MKRNVGDIDSKIRSRLGLILVLLGVLGFVGLLKVGLTVNIVFLAAGLVLFLTGSSRRCGIYSIFGFDTTKPETEE
ncbi:MAG: DUF2892 domain-containing protein [Candidatus Bipolaricaulia bacterium]